MRIETRLDAGILLCDGAMGTELYKRGLDPEKPPECWNIERPEQVVGVHEAYLEAGAEAILTNTFGANRLRLSRRGQYDVREVNRAGVDAARLAADKRGAFVFGDIGPTGCETRLLPLNGQDGTLSAAEDLLYDVFREQAVALARVGVDAILIETMSSLAEAAIAVKAASENTSLCVLCTMSFKAPPVSRPSEFRTFWGNSVSDIVGTLTRAGVTGLGANCGEIVAEVPELTKQMRQMTDLHLVFRPNAGRPHLVVTETYDTVYSLDPGAFADIALEIVAGGGSVIGGCCGTTPAHIAAVHERIAAHLAKEDENSRSDV